MENCKHNFKDVKEVYFLILHFIFVIETYCVFYEVGTEVNIISRNVRLQ
jgi:hypothetical protein